MTDFIAMLKWLLLGFVATLLLLAVTGRAQNPPSVFATPFAGVTKAAASAPVRQIGQSMHTFKVEFPAEVAPVASLRVRLEGSFDNLAYFQISNEITTTYLLLDGTSIYAFGLAYGVFPYIRVNSLNPTPGGKLMTVRYTGVIVPVVPSALRLSDRYTF